MNYFPGQDLLQLTVTDEAGSVELSPHTTAELNADGELIRVEILCRVQEWRRVFGCEQKEW